MHSDLVKGFIPDSLPDATQPGMWKQGGAFMVLPLHHYTPLLGHLQHSAITTITIGVLPASFNIYICVSICLYVCVVSVDVFRH